MSKYYDIWKTLYVTGRNSGSNYDKEIQDREYNLWYDRYKNVLFSETEEEAKQVIEKNKGKIIIVYEE